MNLSLRTTTIVLLGSLLLLLLTTTTTTLAQTTCDPTAAENGCDIDTYCSATDGTCLPIGGCADVVDCSNLNNQPYPALMCMGTMECTQEGLCSMNCGLNPFDQDGSGNNNNETDTDTDTDTDTTTSCMTSAECNNPVDSSEPSSSSSFMMDGEYCGSDSTCMLMGDCSIIEDCMNLDNVFAVPLCMGNMECTDEGRCTMNCGPVDNDTLFGGEGNCFSSLDCAADDYCTSGGICLPVGGCTIDTDCIDINNSPFAVAMCIGTLECQGGTCSKICDTSDVVPFPPPPSDTIMILPDNNVTEEEEETRACDSDDECDIGMEYCSLISRICLGLGQCTVLPDCRASSNMFAIDQCIGVLGCVDGQCAQICNEDYAYNTTTTGTDAATATTTSSSDETKTGGTGTTVDATATATPEESDGAFYQKNMIVHVSFIVMASSLLLNSII